MDDRAMRKFWGSESRPSTPPFRAGWLLLGLAFLGCGCNRQDSERLAQFGRKAADKVQSLTGKGTGKLLAGWQAMRADIDEVALDARVAARLRWDKALANTQIQVLAQGPRIELVGTVADRSQRNRAEDLTQSTAGVEEVEDHLEVMAAEP